MSIFEKTFLCLAPLAASLLLPATAVAYIVDTSVGTYDAVVLTTPPNPQTFDDVEAILESQVWWNDQNLAIEFATAVSFNLGFNSSSGPGFAYSDTVTPNFVEACGWIPLGSMVGCSSVARNETVTLGSPGSATINWVVATQVTTVPVPAAGWLFGSGLLGLIGVVRRKKSM